PLFGVSPTCSSAASLAPPPVTSKLVTCGSGGKPSVPLAVVKVVQSVKPAEKSPLATTCAACVAVAESAAAIAAPAISKFRIDDLPPRDRRWPDGSQPFGA